MRSAAVLLLLASCAGETAPTVQPDALDQLDQLAGCNDTANSAWPQYQEILGRLRPPADGTAFACRIVPGHERWPLLADWLQSNRELLPLIQAAAGKRHFGMSHRAAKGSSRVAYVTLQHNRMLANLLCVASREAEAADDLTRAVSLVHAAIRLGQQIVRRPLMADRTIGVSLTGIACRELRRLLYTQAGRWTRQDLQVLADPSLVTHAVRPLAEAQRIEQLIGANADANMVQRSEDAALSEMEQVRAVLALVAFRHIYDRFPDRLDQLGPAVAAIPHVRYLPPRGGRGPLLYLVMKDDADPFAVQPPADLEDRTLEAVWPVAPPR